MPEESRAAKLFGRVFQEVVEPALSVRLAVASLFREKNLY